MAVGLLLTTTACGAGTAVDTPATGVAQPGTDEAHAAHTTPSSGRASAAQLARTTPSAAVDLRSRLEELLGAHVLFADELVRARLAGQRARQAAVTDSVERNQETLVELVTSAAGPPAGQAFATAWQNHVDVLGAYATALEDGDTVGQQAARDSYVRAEGQLADVFSTLVGGRVPKADLAAAAAMHGNHLLEQADAYAAGDYDKAYTIQREAFSHMIVVADVLARGAAAEQELPSQEFDAPRRQLQTALSRLLAEHMGLIVQLMRAAHDDAPDLPGAGKATNANTAELGGAIAALYGEPASTAFLDLWGQHVEGLVAYADAPAGSAARDAARRQEEDYAPQLARFLAGATEGRLPAIDLAAALTEHDDHLMDQADAYAEDDLMRAQELSEMGYAHMFALSQTLATAIGDTVAARLPRGGAATGGGALARGR